jgi:hypothetical protein
MCNSCALRGYNTCTNCLETSSYTYVLFSRAFGLRTTNSLSTFYTKVMSCFTTALMTNLYLFFRRLYPMYTGLTITTTNIIN